MGLLISAIVAIVVFFFILKIGGKILKLVFGLIAIALVVALVVYLLRAGAGALG